MINITSEMVVEAYRKTGLQPCRYNFFERGTEEAVVRACALGVVLIANGDWDPAEGNSAAWRALEKKYDSQSHGIGTRFNMGVGEVYRAVKREIGVDW